ncbi:CLCA_X family protein [Celerinatantimonas yamalensis]|uniref:CLCA_X family protein n=1 Tax=Celerinatantimonas yamalensis TaxID=559956 RepID=A0ABW9G4J1_9GAMM
MPSHPWQHRYTRNGPDYRFDSNVSFIDIKQQFGFSTIRLGRWVSIFEQQLAANLIFDALADLSFILNVPPSTLGLRQSLHLAFGCDGSVDAKAHYQPNKRTLALAKNAGGGALAHEFWHAFDHYITQHLYPHAREALASHAWLHHHQYASHPLNERLVTLFNHAMLGEDATQPSRYLQQAIALDKHHQSHYYSQPTELMARAFEAFVQDSEITNDFLVSGSHQSLLAKAGGYPQGDCRKQLNQNFYQYFTALGQALQAQKSIK